MRIIYHPEAEAEFIAAIDYYDRAVEGLGDDFREMVIAACDRIAEQPQIHPLFKSTQARGRIVD